MKLLALIPFVAILLVATLGVSPASPSACTPTITSAQMANWTAEFNNIPKNDPPSAFAAWIASGPSREVPQLACLSRVQLGQIWNVGNVWIGTDTGASLRDATSALNFCNDIVATSGSVYNVTPKHLYWYDGHVIHIAAWSG